MRGGTINNFSYEIKFSTLTVKNPFIPSDLATTSDHAVSKSVEHYRELFKRLSRVANPHVSTYQTNVAEALSEYEAELERRRQVKSNRTGDWFQIWR